MRETPAWQVGSIKPVKEPQTLDVGSFTARLEQVALPMGLVLDVVNVVGERIHLEKEPFQIQLASPGQLEVTVSEKSLEAFLNAKSPGNLSGFEVTLVNERIYIQATAHVIVPIKAAAVCTLRIEGGKQLFVDLESVDVLGVGAKKLVQSQLDSINPVLDASDLPLEARLTSSAVAKGAVVLRGEIEPKPV
jgi:hypothetical protein